MLKKREVFHKWYIHRISCCTPNDSESSASSQTGGFGSGKKLSRAKEIILLFGHDVQDLFLLRFTPFRFDSVGYSLSNKLEETTPQEPIEKFSSS